jgi:gliding motility-associated-like protein
MVTVNPKPIISFNGDVLVGCAPLRVNFANTSAPGGDDCLWTFSDGTTATGCGTISKTFDYSGTYDVGLTVTTTEGCTDNMTVTDYINVSPVPEAFFSFSPGVVTVNNPEIEFTNSSINADSYTWTFGDGSSDSNEENPSHLFPAEEGQYEILLVAESNGGCVDSTLQTIIVQDVLVFYVPNTFTPDGDNFNQVFKPVIASGVDIYDYHFTIFNRWGEILFESYNTENGWDGTYGNRGLVDDEVYVWQIEFGETMSDKTHRYRGHVTVLK